MDMAPELQIEWVARGRSDEDDGRVHIGNLWSSNAMDLQLKFQVNEQCPHRDHIISLNPPFYGFGDLQREELRGGRLMMILPLTGKEKNGQMQWRALYGQPEDGYGHRIGANFMETYTFYYGYFRNDVYFWPLFQ